MAGIIAAAIGLLLAQLTGDPFYDGAASIVIGVILAMTAMVLAYEFEGPADRRSRRPRSRQESSRARRTQPGVVGVGHVLTVHSAPDQVTVDGNVDFATISRRRSRAFVSRSRARRSAALAPGSPPVRPPDAGRGQGTRKTLSHRVIGHAGRFLHHDPDAVRGPFLVDIDVELGPFVAGSALDGLDAAPGDGIHAQAISRVFGADGRSRRPGDCCRQRQHGGNDHGEKDDHILWESRLFSIVGGTLFSRTPSLIALVDPGDAGSWPCGVPACAALHLERPRPRTIDGVRVRPMSRAYSLNR